MIITSNKSTDTGRVLFDQLAEAYIERPGVGLGRMMSSQGLTINKKIFAMSVRGRLVVKVPAKQVRAWTADGRGEPFEPRPGRLMREWLSVPYEPGGTRPQALEFPHRRRLRVRQHPEQADHIAKFGRGPRPYDGPRHERPFPRARRGRCRRRHASRHQ